MFFQLNTPFFHYYTFTDPRTNGFALTNVISSMFILFSVDLFLFVITDKSVDIYLESYSLETLEKIKLMLL